MNVAMTIWIKELRDTIRDRRTLYAMIIMPLALYPLLMYGIAKLAIREETKAQEHVAVLAVQAADQAPALMSMLHKNPQFKVIRTADARSDVKSQTADVGLVVPSAFENSIGAGGGARVTIIEDSLRTYSERGVDKVRSALRDYTDTVVARRLDRLGASSAMLEPFATDVVDTATKEQRGGKVLAYILPMFIILWAIAGGMYTAMDVSAGEKERNTLEALLLTPASRTQIVTGKFLAVTTTSTVAVLLSLFSLSLSAQFLIPKGAENVLKIAISAGVALLMLIPSVLVAAMFAALLIAVSIFAKSFKEAQAYVTPLYLVAFLPVVAINMLQDYKPPTAMFAVPVFNTMVLFKELLVGDVNPAHITVTVASLAVFAAGSILLAAWLFGKESVMFRS